MCGTIILSDEAPNGAGYVERMAENFKTILKEIVSGRDLFVRKIIEYSHVENCDRTCYIRHHLRMPMRTLIITPA
jgi:hypothetical protein